VSRDFFQMLAGSNESNLALFETDVSATAGPVLAFGETATFRATAVLLQGTTGLTVTVKLPPASSPYLNITRAVVTGVASTISTSPAGLLFNGSTPTGVPLDTDGNGLRDTVVFSYASVTNSGGGAVGSRIFMDIFIQAVNRANVPSGTVNDVFAELATDSLSLNFTIPMTSSIPSISSSAVFSPVSAVDAGDRIQCIITLSPTAQATGPAFNVTIPLNISGLSPLPASAILLANADVAPAAVPSWRIVSSANEKITFIVDMLDPSIGSVTLRFDSDLLESVRPSAALNRSGIYSWASHPTAQSTAAASFSNNLPFLSQVQIKSEIANAVTLNRISTLIGYPNGAVAVGDDVTYRISAQIIEGTSNLTIRVDLASGIAAAQLRVRQAYVDFVGSGIRTESSPLTFVSNANASVLDSNADGVAETALFAFGPSLVNRGDNVLSSGDSIDVVVIATVLSTPAVANQARLATFGSVVAESAIFSFADTLVVVEPFLDSFVQLSSTEGMSGTTIRATIALSHSVETASRSTADAFSVKVSLSASEEVYAAIAPNVAVSGLPTTAWEFVSVNGSLVVTIYRYRLPANGGPSSISIAFDLRFGDAAIPGSSISAAIVCTYDSAPTVSARSRSMATLFELTVVPPSSDVSFALVSSDVSSTSGNQLSIGERVLLQARSVLTDGTTRPFTVVVSVPDDSASEFAELLSIAASAFGSSVVTPVVASSSLVDANGDSKAQQAIWNATSGIVVRGDGQTTSADDFVTVDVSLVVIDSTAAYSAAVLESSALITAVSSASFLRQSFTIVEPRIIADGLVLASSGDAGDVVPLSFSIRHLPASTSGAFGVQITISLPQFVPAAASIAVNGSWQLVESASGVLTMRIAEIPLGSSIAISFDAIVADTARAGDVLVPTAAVDWSSHPDPLRARTRSSAVPVTGSFSIVEVLPTLPVFTRVASTLDQPDSAVSVGERITYSVLVTLLEGTSYLSIDAISSYAAAIPQLNIRSAVVSVVGAQLNQTSSALARVGANATLFDRNGDSRPDRCVFDFGSGLINHGDNVLNSGDTVQVEITFEVPDSVSVVNSVALELELVVYTDTTTFSFSDTLTVVEPLLQAVVRFGVDEAAGGNLLPVYVDISHTAASTSAAYSVDVSAIIDPQTDLVSLSALQVLGASSWGIISVNSSTLVVRIASVPLSSTVTLQFVLFVDYTVRPGDLLIIGGTIDYFSVPKTASFVPRKSSFVETEAFKVSNTTGKSNVIILDTDVTATLGSDLSLGEEITFRASAVLVDGTSNLVVTVYLPTVGTAVPSFKLLSSGISTIGADLSNPSGLFVGLDADVQFDSDGDGSIDRLEWRLDSILNINSNRSSGPQDTISFDIVARLEDFGVLNNLDSIGEGFRVDIVTQGESLSFLTRLTTVEPFLYGSANMSPTSGDAGDLVDVVIALAHTAESLSSAFNVTLDIFLPQLTADLSSTTVTIGSVPTTAWVVSSSESFANGSTLVSLMIEEFPFSQSGDLRVSFTVAVNESSIPGSRLHPACTIAWRSHPSWTSPRFNSTTVPFATFDVVPNELSSSMVAVTATSLSATPNLEAAVGEVFNYSLRFALVEGTSDFAVNISISPALLASGFSFAPEWVITVGANLKVSGPLANISSVGLIQLRAQSVINSGDNIANSADMVVVSFAVAVSDVSSAQPLRGASFSPNISLYASGANITVASTTGASLTVVEPQLQLSALPTAPADAGDDVEHSITISHSIASDGPAFNIQVDVALDSHQVLNVSSLSLTGPNCTTTANTTHLSVICNLMTVEDILIVNYHTALLDSAPAASGLADSVRLSYSSSPSESSRNFGPIKVNSSTETLGPLSSSSMSATPRSGDLRPGVGENVTLSFNCTLFEGNYDELRVRIEFDNAQMAQVQIRDSALAFFGGGLLSPPSVAISYITDANGIPRAAEFVLRNMTNVASNSMSSLEDDLVFSLTVTILPTADNISGFNRVLSPNLTATAGSKVFQQTFAFSVGAPSLSIEMTFSPDPIDVGSIVSVTVNITHTLQSSSSAFGVLIEVSLPSDASLVLGSVVAPSNAHILRGNASEDPLTLMRAIVNEISYSQGFAVLRFDLVVSSSIFAGQLLVHNSTIDWSSSNTSNAAHYGPISTSFSLESGFPQIEISHNRSTTVAFGTSSGSPKHVAIGDIVAVRIVASLPSTTKDLVVAVTRSLPNVQVSIVSGQVVAIGADLDLSQSLLTTSSVASISLDRQTGSFAMGLAQRNRDGSLTEGDKVAFIFQVRLDDSPGNYVSGSNLSLSSSVSYSAGLGLKSDSLNLTIVQPELELKVLEFSFVAADKVAVTFQMQHRNVSTSAAYGLTLDVIFDDVVLQIDSWSSPFVNSAASGNALSVSELSSAIFGANAIVNVTVTFKVLATARISSDAILTATAVWSSSPNSLYARRSSALVSATLPRPRPTASFVQVAALPESASAFNVSVGVGYRIQSDLQFTFPVGTFADTLVKISLPFMLEINLENIEIKSQISMRSTNFETPTNASAPDALVVWSDSWKPFAVISNGSLLLDLGNITSDTPPIGFLANVLRLRFVASVLNLHPVAAGGSIPPMNISLSFENSTQASASSASLSVREPSLSFAVLSWPTTSLASGESVLVSIELSNPQDFFRSASSHAIFVRCAFNASRVRVVAVSSSDEFGLLNVSTGVDGMIALNASRLNEAKSIKLNATLQLVRSDAFIFGDVSFNISASWSSLDTNATGITRNYTTQMSRMLTLNAPPLPVFELGSNSSKADAPLFVGFSREFQIKLSDFIRDGDAGPGLDIDIASLEIVVGSEHGYAVVVSNSSVSGGLIRYTSNGNNSNATSDTFVVRLCDKHGECINQTFVFAIIQLPELTPDSFTLSYDAVELTIYPLLNDDLVDPRSVNFNLSTFALLGNFTYGFPLVEIVPLADIASNFTYNSSSHNNQTIAVRYNLTALSEAELYDFVNYTVCDVRGVCAREPATINIFKRAKPSDSTGIDTRGWCVAGTLNTVASAFLGFAGPMMPNLIWYTIEYEQFISFSSQLSGRILPPDNLTAMTDCFSWTMAMLPAPDASKKDSAKYYGKRSTLEDAPLEAAPITTAGDSLFSRLGISPLGFFTVFLFWLLIAFILFMVFGLLCCVVPACFCMKKVFEPHKDLKKKPKAWNRMHIGLLMIGVLFRFLYVAYMPFIMWTFQSFNLGASATIVCMIFVIGIPAGYALFYFLIARRVGFDVLYGNWRWYATFGALYTNFKHGFEWWPLLTFAKWIIFAICVSFISRGNIAAACVIMLVVAAAYLLLTWFKKPHVRIWALWSDLVLSAGEVIILLLLIFVMYRMIPAWPVILIHAVVLFILLILLIINFALWLLGCLAGRKKDKKQGDAPASTPTKPTAASSSSSSYDSDSDSSSSESHSVSSAVESSLQSSSAVSENATEPESGSDSPSEDSTQDSESSQPEAAQSESDIPMDESETPQSDAGPSESEAATQDSEMPQSETEQSEADADATESHSVRSSRSASSHSGSSPLSSEEDSSISVDT
jgi:hypothetical protein